MTSLSNNFSLLLALSAFFIVGKMAKAGTVLPSESAQQNLFSADIFQKIVVDKTTENVIFSPASIRSCVALSFFGANGQTAQEIRNGLRLGSGEREDIAKNYGDFIKANFKSSKDENSAQLRMANRIYVNDNLQIKPAFNKLATEYFQSEAEKLHFADSANAVKKINSWVEGQTENKITNLLSQGAVDGDTSSILVNAIYFKAKWAKPFSLDSTHKADFMANGKEKVSVDTMYMEETVPYAEIPELDATAVELAYKNTDLSMLVILPNKVDGLKDLEKKLANRDLNEITSKLSRHSTNVFIPKFRVEFDVDLKKPLQELGMATMFSDNADFSDLFQDAAQQKVSDVKHKAYIDVNEAGSEAAAATFVKITPMSLNLDQKTFRADHPFVFAIRNPAAVYFAGHVTKF